ncbi:hypothetical protein ACA910_002984 [Epithemia clementina (nom. ined.)]
MSASQLDNGQTRCDYHYRATESPSGAFGKLPNGNGVTCGSPVSFRVAVAEFGRASSVDNDVVTRAPTRTTWKNEPSSDDAQTDGEQSCFTPSARHELVFKHSLTESDTSINFSLQHKQRSGDNNQQQENPRSVGQSDQQSIKSTSALIGLEADDDRQTSSLAGTERNDFHDSIINSGTSGGSIDSEPRLRGNTTSGSSNTLPNRAIFDTSGTSDRDSASLSGANMGYSSTSGHISWQVPQADFAGIKMEPAQQHTISGHQNSSSEHEGKDHHDEDSTTIRSTDSASIGSPSHGPLAGPSVIEPTTGVSGAISGVHSNATTPSTVSTAPSTTDDGSMGALDPNTLERLALRAEALDSNPLFHRGGPPWEHYQSQLYVPDETDQGTFSTAVLPPSHPSAGVASTNSWANPRHTNQRVATFRNDIGLPNNGLHEQQRWHQPPQIRYDTNSTPPMATVRSGNKGPGYVPMPYAPYHGGLANRVLPANTPPRTGRPVRPVPSPGSHRPSPVSGSSPQSNQIQTGSAASSNPRSPSEVLKTLLRKKACLYEPDTSRAVALATWLVGRELALEFGYFSRQQLQAGVHACVAGKIDSGVITRTKVNRCMQIILNSCFHYIIPRPDGSEEKGDAFRLLFSREVTDDNDLLHELPTPWNDLAVNHDVVLEASLADLDGKQSRASDSAPSTPQTSPRLGSVQAEKSSPRSRDDGDADSKRAVLLCFNENVRCAEDVFRCHNEFIRDTAHASGLQLSSTEWRSFFGREAANAQQLWGNIAIPVPRTGNFAQSDVLGMMTHSELAKFRTTWCAKRYDHDHELCGFAHVEVNGGWLRRNFLQFDYGMEMCPDVVHVPTGHSQENRRFVVNACPRGVYCGFTHSQEEILYHPRRYKNKLCSSLARLGGCSGGDVCPDFHPVESYKFPTKKNEGRLNARQSRQQGAGSSKSSPVPPLGAPILYCNPAPISRFEEQLQLPGLKNLYRRHCSVVKAHLRNPASCFCCYSCFGDDEGTAIDPMKLSRSFKKPGLPQPRGV